MDFVPYSMVMERRATLFRGKYQVNVDLRERLRHDHSLDAPGTQANPGYAKREPWAMIFNPFGVIRGWRLDPEAIL